MTNEKISVLIVDDSPSARELLTFIINRSPHLEVIGCVEDGEKALKFIQYRRPDVITMDVVMPRIDGFETTRRIMGSSPIPIVVVTSSFNPDDVDKSFKAFDAGAVAILGKPRGPQDPHFPRMSKTITETIRNVSDVKLVTRRHKKALPESIPDVAEQRIEAVVIGASLGGPQALQTILSELPANFPVPIFIVQHISQGFITGFASWLNETTPLSVKVAIDGTQAKPGEVIIAPDDYQLQVAAENRIKLIRPAPNDPLCPAVSYLFSSAASTYGTRAIGVILTGMGSDGVNELLQMKERGAITIAQDEEGCIMFGMPKEAIAKKAAKHVVPLPEIAKTLTLLTARRKVVS